MRVSKTIVGEPAYFDGFATTPLAPEAREAMLLASLHPGNAGSPHSAGARASDVLRLARHHVASLIGADTNEIIFTSGATEADNLAIRGIAKWAMRNGDQRRKIIVSAIEHKAVLEAADSLRAEGFQIVHAPVTAQGVVDLAAAERLIDSATLLVSVMLANNETGALQPVAAVAAIAHRLGALVHCDAAQAVGKIPVNVDDLEVDYLSISAHKMYGPMGVGALYIAAGAPKPSPLSYGGKQEGAIRPGTEPTYLLAAFGAAAQLAKARLENDMAHSRSLVGAFCSALTDAGLAYTITTGTAASLPGSLSISLHDISADSIISSLSPYASISTGSACNSGQILPSHVLLAMGIPADMAHCVIRLYFGRYNSIEEISSILPIFIKAVQKHRSLLDDSASRM